MASALAVAAGGDGDGGERGAMTAVGRRAVISLALVSELGYGSGWVEACGRRLLCMHRGCAASRLLTVIRDWART